MNRLARALSLGLFLFSFLCSISRAADSVTIVYDAFGADKHLTKDWGFSALVEHGGKKILFDAGNNAEIFEKNVTALSIDLTKLDFVVISHRNTDHASGTEIRFEDESRRDSLRSCGWLQRVWRCGNTSLLLQG